MGYSPWGLKESDTTERRSLTRENFRILKSTVDQLSSSVLNHISAPLTRPVLTVSVNQIKEHTKLLTKQKQPTAVEEKPKFPPVLLLENNMAKSVSQEQKNDISDIKRYAHTQKKKCRERVLQRGESVKFFLSIIFLDFVTRVGFLKSALKSIVTHDF